MADINKTINIDVNVESQKLDKASQGMEKITKSTDAHTKALDHNRKGILENGGAMGLLGAATGGLAMDFKDAVEAIEMTGISLKGLRGAIIATGIGALAIVLLELITNWEKWKGVIDGSTAALERQAVAIKNLETENENINLIRSRELALAEAQGVAEEQLYLMRKAENQSFIDQKNAEIAAQEALQNALNLTSEEAQKASEEWMKAEEKKRTLYIEVNNLITQGQAMPFAEEKRLRDKALEEQKTANEKRLANEKALNDKLVAFIKNRADLNIKELEALLKEFDRINEGINNLDAGKYGEIYDELKSIFDLYKASQKNIYEADKKIEELNEQKRYAAKGEQKVLDDKIKALEDELEIRKEGFRTIVNPQLKREIDLVKEKANEQIKASYAERNSYAEINDLITEEMTLLNKMGQDDGMRKKDLAYFAEKNEDINALYEIRLKMFDKASKAEIDSAEKTAKFYEDTQAKLEKQQAAFGSIGQLIKESVKEGGSYGEVFSVALEGMNVKDFAADNTIGWKSIRNGITITKDSLVQYQEAVSNLFGYEVDMNKLTIDEKQRVADFLISLDDKLLGNNINIAKANTDLAKANSDARLGIAQITADKQIEISQNMYDKLTLQDEARIQHKQDMLNAEMGLADAAAGLLSTFAEDNKDVMRASIIADSAIGIGKMIIANNQANIGALATPQAILTGEASAAPIIAMNNIATGLGIAANIAATAKALSKVGGGGADTGGAAAAGPQAKFNIVGSSTSNQLAATIAQQQNQPVKAYVVGTDMTTQQALDRNIQKSATFL